MLAALLVGTWGIGLHWVLVSGVLLNMGLRRGRIAAKAAHDAGLVSSASRDERLASLKRWGLAFAIVLAARAVVSLVQSVEGFGGQAGQDMILAAFGVIAVLGFGGVTTAVLQVLSVPVMVALHFVLTGGAPPDPTGQPVSPVPRVEQLPGNPDLPETLPICPPDG